MNRPDVTREGNKRVHCTRDFSQTVTNPRFIKQDATLVSFMLFYQNIFVPIKVCHYIDADFCSWSDNVSHYNPNVLSQCGMPQCNSLNVQSWPKFQSAKWFSDSKWFWRLKSLTSQALSFRTGWETKQLYAGPDSAFFAFLLPIHSTHLYCHERPEWGRPNWLCSRAQETLYGT